jgi:hypothetical protein
VGKLSTEVKKKTSSKFSRNPERQRTYCGKETRGSADQKASRHKERTNGKQARLNTSRSEISVRYFYVRKLPAFYLRMSAMRLVMACVGVCPRMFVPGFTSTSGLAPFLLCSLFLLVYRLDLPQL